MDNRDAHVSAQETRHSQVRLLSFVGKLQGESFEELSCSVPNQTTSGDNKRGEVLRLLQAEL
jgi:hypothetical protein